MGKIAAIDFGTVRMGVAISDERQCMALPLGTITLSERERRSLSLSAGRVAEYLQSHSLTKVVIGHPRHLNGKESKMSCQVNEWKSLLQEAMHSLSGERTTPLSCVLWEERLTSIQAERHFRELGRSRKKSRAHIDVVSAVFILQSYLDASASLDRYMNVV